MIRRTSSRFGLVFGLCVLASAAQAEQGWVKDELRLNIRTGAGTQYRIVGVLQTGDKVEVVSRGETWTQVRASDDRSGWIPKGYLQAEAPARLTVDRYTREAAELREQVDTLTKKLESISSGHSELSSRDGDQRAEIERLTRENMELLVGARWPEWMAGAAILIVGGLLGMWIRGAGGGRPSRRIRI